MRSPASPDPGSSQSGAVSIELVATLPFLGLALLVAAQIAISGAALWSAAISARAGARAQQVGAEPGPAARRALPPPLREGAGVTHGEGVGEGKGIRVRVEVPKLLPGLPPIAVGAHSSLGPGGGGG